ncbi:MAG: hypothetical protein NTV34_08440 [Proteobacteria bacterium]|nr:hypothetical protein [Pseudomonadota bacterium]
MSNLGAEQLVYYARARIGPESVIVFKHPLLRRMTWTSKAILEAVSQWESRHGVLLSDIVAAHRVAVFYGTLFGEMEAGLKVAGGILKPQEVISPSAFQQSVHNAPVAYLMQMLQYDGSTATITSGIGSFGRALAMASSDLLYNLVDVVFVLQAAEYHISKTGDGVVAEAELCVITSGQKIGRPASWRLESVLWCQNEVNNADYDKSSTLKYKSTTASVVKSPEQPVFGASSVFPESRRDELEKRRLLSVNEHFPERINAESGDFKQALYAEPLSLDERTESFLRHEDCGHGRMITSSWQQLVPGLRGVRASELLPHERPSLLVEALLEVEQDGSSWVEAILSADSIVFDNGEIRPHSFIEVLAQAAGVGLNAARRVTEPGSAPKIGYLISVDEFDSTGAGACKPGDVLKIRVVLEANIFPVAKCGLTAFLRGSIVAKGSMKFLSAENLALKRENIEVAT